MSFEKKWREFQEGTFSAETVTGIPRTTIEGVSIFRTEGILRDHVVGKRVFVFERLNNRFQNVGREQDDGRFQYELLLFFSDESFYILIVNESDLWNIREIPNWVQTEGSIHFFFSQVAPHPSNTNIPFVIERHEEIEEDDMQEMLRTRTIYKFPQDSSNAEEVGLITIKASVWLTQALQHTRTEYVPTEGVIRAFIYVNDNQSNNTNFGELVTYDTVLRIPFYYKEVVNKNASSIIDDDEFFTDSQPVINVKKDFTVYDLFLTLENEQPRAFVPSPTDGEQFLDLISYKRRFPSKIRVDIRVPEDVSDNIEYMYESSNNQFFIKMSGQPEKKISLKEFKVLDFVIIQANKTDSVPPPFVKVSAIWIRPWLTGIIKANGRQVYINDRLVVVPKPSLNIL